VAANLVFSMSHETLHFRHIFVLYAMVAAAYVVVTRPKPAAEPPEPVREPASASS
jgi:hypothetical protein